MKSGHAQLLKPVCDTLQDEFHWARIERDLATPSQNRSNYNRHLVLIQPLELSGF